MSVENQRCAVEERKVCISSVIPSDGKFYVNLTAKLGNYVEERLEIIVRYLQHMFLYSFDLQNM